MSTTAPSVTEMTFIVDEIYVEFPGESEPALRGRGFELKLVSLNDTNPHRDEQLSIPTFLIRCVGLKIIAPGH